MTGIVHKISFTIIMLPVWSKACAIRLSAIMTLTGVIFHNDNLPDLHEAKTLVTSFHPCVCVCTHVYVCACDVCLCVCVLASICVRL